MSTTNAASKIQRLQAQLSGLQQEIRQGSCTISGVAEQWLMQEKLTVKQSTYAKYRTNLDTHILPQLGQMEVSDLNMMMVNTYIDYLRQDGRIDGKGGLSAKYIRDLYTILKGIVRYAEMEYSVPNTIKNCKIPPKGEVQSIALTRRQQRRLEDFLRKDLGNPKKLGILLCLYTGLRIGEVCALQWKHVNLDTGVLEVCQTVQRIQNPVRDAKPKTYLLIGEPKSRASLRVVPIPTFLRGILEKYRSTRDAEAYFLTNTRLMIMEPRNYQYHFKKYMQELHMEWVHFHTLRHTFATRAIESGMDMKALSEMLGHAGVSITMDRYVHSSVEEKKRQMERMCM